MYPNKKEAVSYYDTASLTFSILLKDLKCKNPCFYATYLESTSATVLPMNAGESTT